MLTDAQRFAVENFVGGTTSPVDLAHQAMILRALEGEDREEARTIILAKRAAWQQYQARWQRKWQSKTRRPSRAAHHDSVSIREKYVRY